MDVAGAAGVRAKHQGKHHRHTKGQPCMQGSSDAACLLCKLRAVNVHTTAAGMPQCARVRLMRLCSSQLQGNVEPLEAFMLADHETKRINSSAKH
jgi:hypothetical protein